MKKSNKRAVRRVHTARLKKQAPRKMLMLWGEMSPTDPRACGKYAATCSACPCWQCGNPRKYTKDKLTVSEKRDRARFADADPRFFE